VTVRLTFNPAEYLISLSKVVFPAPSIPSNKILKVDFVNIYYQKPLNKLNIL
jgi:hypothetical protein